MNYESSISYMLQPLKTLLNKIKPENLQTKQKNPNQRQEKLNE